MAAAALMDIGSLGIVPKPEARTLKEQEYNSIKHALPKTRISHAILHENTSQDRHLNMKLSAISHHQNKVNNSFDQNKRNFIETQLRKNRKWKSQDEMGAATMNFPNLRSDASRRPSMVVVYQSPQYYEKDEDTVKQAGIIDGKLLPYMTIRRERTEILQHSGTTYTTKLPTVIQVEDRKLQRYNTYCGITRDLNVIGGAPVKDERFTQVLKTLTPRDSDIGVKVYLGEGADDDDNKSVASSLAIAYSHFGGKNANRARGLRPPVIFPTLQANTNSGAADTGPGVNQSDSNKDGRFNSPTLRKTFNVKSAKAH